MKVKVTEATREQLRTYLLRTLGMQPHLLPENTGMDKLHAKLREITADEEIDVPDAAPPSVSRDPAPTARKSLTDILGPKRRSDPPKYLKGVPTTQSGRYDPVVNLTLHKTEELNRAAEVSVNGRTMLVARGIAQVVPYRYYLALKAAIRTVYDDDGDGGYTVREIDAHPMSVNQYPSAEEIAEWDFYFSNAPETEEQAA